MNQKLTRLIKLQHKYRSPQGSGCWPMSGPSLNTMVPWLNLSGRWLEAAGFQPGNQVEITVNNNLLIIKNLGDGDTKH